MGISSKQENSSAHKATFSLITPGLAGGLIDTLG
jgi:hypothetical protein